MTLGDRVVVMNAGLIQQAGPPLEVYRRPVNRFVASFVGTPPMNFLDGRLERDGEGADCLWFVEGSSDPEGRPYRLPLTAAHRARLASHVGREVVLGIRPQAMTERTPGAPGLGPDRTALRLMLRVVEPLGDSMDLFCSTPKHAQIVARVPARTGVNMGTPVDLVVDMSAAHVFEPGPIGVNLTVADRGSGEGGPPH